MHLYCKAKNHLVTIPKELIAELLDLHSYFTTSELKQKVGINYNVVYQIQRNKRRRTKAETLRKMKAFIREIKQRKREAEFETAIYVI